MQTSLLGVEEICACCTSLRLRIGAILLLTFSLLFFLFALYIPSAIQTKLHDGIKDYVSLSPDSLAQNTKGFQVWSDSSSPDSVPVYQSIYLFNISNPAEILANPQTKPNLTQHGPYTYLKVNKKFDFSYQRVFPSNKQQLTYKSWTYYVFQPSLSVAGGDPLQDKFLQINVPFQAITNILSGALPFVYSKINASCYSFYPDEMAKMFAMKTVDEILFGENDCISLAANQLGLLTGPFPGLIGPNNVPSATITQAFMSNNTLPDTIYTGVGEYNEDDESLLRQYAKYQTMDYLEITRLVSGISPSTVPLWNSSAANLVAGTDGTQFAVGLKEGSTVLTFVDDLDRKIALVNANNQHETFEGIDLLRFTIDPTVLLNTTQEPANFAYYGTGINGLLDLTFAKRNFPIFMSKPHFLDGDQALVDDIIGLSPNRDEHDTHLDVEPITGATMNAAKRLQINYKMQPLVVDGGLLSWYKTLGLHYTPVAWIDEHASIPSNKASDFKSSVYGALDAIKYVWVLGITFGILFLVGGIVLFLIASRRIVDETKKMAGINDYQQ